MLRVVLDTNCLIASLSKHGEYYAVWNALQQGRYCLCVTDAILDEYQEIIERLTTPTVAKNVIGLLLKSHNVELIDPRFKLRLIVSDPDDNKFVDCAFAANAACIVSEDRHFDVLKEVEFPKIPVLKLADFLSKLQPKLN